MSTPIAEMQWPNASVGLIKDAAALLEKGNETIEQLVILNRLEIYLFVALYLITALVALLGNLIAIVVICYGSKFSKELRPFLLSLSISDIAMALFSIPFTFTNLIYYHWIFPVYLCSFVQMMQMTSVVASVFTMAAIGIDRLLAIRHPFLGVQTHVYFRRASLLFNWSFAFALGAMQFVMTSAVPLDVTNRFGEVIYDCRELWNPTQLKIVTASILLIIFVLPFLLLIFTYGLIIYEIWKQPSPGETNATRDQIQHEARLKILKLAFTVVLLFNVCWLPFHCWNFLLYFARSWVKRAFSTKMYIYITILFHWLSMCNSFVNPLIYRFYNANFKHDWILIKLSIRAWLGRRINQLRNISSVRSKQATLLDDKTEFPKVNRKRYQTEPQSSSINGNQVSSKSEYFSKLSQENTAAHNSNKAVVVAEVSASDSRVITHYLLNNCHKKPTQTKSLGELTMPIKEQQNGRILKLVDLFKFADKDAFITEEVKRLKLPKRSPTFP